MKTFVKPNSEVIEFENEDVITTSGGNGNETEPIS